MSTDLIVCLGFMQCPSCHTRKGRPSATKWNYRKERSERGRTPPYIGWAHPRCSLTSPIFPPGNEVPEAELHVGSRKDSAPPEENDPEQMGSVEFNISYAQI